MIWSCSKLVAIIGLGQNKIQVTHFSHQTIPWYVLNLTMSLLEGFPKITPTSKNQVGRINWMVCLLDKNQ